MTIIVKVKVFILQSASDFARTSAEADVCKDLIDNYRDLFNVTKEELDREEAIMRKTENFNRNPNPVKVSMIHATFDTALSSLISLSRYPGR